MADFSLLARVMVVPEVCNPLSMSQSVDTWFEVHAFIRWDYAAQGYLAKRQAVVLAFGNVGHVIENGVPHWRVIHAIFPRMSDVD